MVAPDLQIWGIYAKQMLGKNQYTAFIDPSLREAQRCDSQAWIATLRSQ
jgi:hypothetical protein